MKNEIVNDPKIDAIKDDYCPACCFDDESDVDVLRKDCKKHGNKESL